ncbi:DUF2304 domain-containing protein [Paenibacillus sp. N4]|uniref:DUF2304 domain-containing protein n=1 Tax=Paenibacillus vietnamensis TaxID=2590547 RepID=UPI001CD17D05|nr:DUF2304 domain-containing protein [Paenibacillus vietnamensis]MCA0756659.1 DUF2304 domain-containing protein [Paenibacillus vietnamensis]
MDYKLKWFILLCGITFSGVIIRLLLKKKISARNSVMWLLSAAAILILSANPGWFDRLAGVLGVSYPPSLLFLFSTLVLLVIVLYQSMQISVLNEKLRQLAQYVALLEPDRDIPGNGAPGENKADS